MTAPYYTGKGDSGQSGLFGNSVRIAKHDPIFELLGTLDELNAWLGLCRAAAAADDPGSPLCAPLEQAQHALFTLQAQAAGADKRLDESHVAALQGAISTLSAGLAAPHGFCLPGSTLLGAQFDLARTVARRAERVLLSVAETRIIPGLSPATAYLNRLSSLLYVLVRYANQQKGAVEIPPDYGG